MFAKEEDNGSKESKEPRLDLEIVQVFQDIELVYFEMQPGAILIYYP
jgi:hypothetical protein